MRPFSGVYIKYSTAIRCLKVANKRFERPWQIGKSDVAALAPASFQAAAGRII